jgi:2-polyprenyl-3-methyl-5-hydroxy-6-metoxy-1,4-benzoquinol methylase
MKLPPLLEPILQTLRINKIMPHIPKTDVLVDIGCGDPPVLLDKLAAKVQLRVGIDEDVNPRKDKDLIIKHQVIKKKINLRDNYADIVTMLAVLEHLKYPQEISKDVYRILKPGGTLLITVPSPRNKLPLDFLSWLGLVRDDMIDQHENYFNTYDLRTLFTHAGFKSVQVELFELGLNTFVKAIK